MHRVPVAIALLVAIVPLLLAPVTVAQDATPAAGQAAGTPVPVRTRALASGFVEVLAPGTGTIALGRITLAPGGSLPFNPLDTPAILVYMTGGELTVRVTAPMKVARGGTAGTPVPAQPEAVEANTEFTMREGDSVLFPPSVAGEIRNDGDDDATLLVVGLTLVPEATGTPTP